MDQVLEPKVLFCVAAATVLITGVYWYRQNSNAQAPPKTKEQPPPKPREPFTLEICKQFFSFPDGVTMTPQRYDGNLTKWSIFTVDDPDRIEAFNMLFSGDVSPELDKAMGILIGNVVGDALGAPFEFSHLQYNIQEMKKGFEDAHIWTQKGRNHFDLKPGQWTDDASMALCLCDSLLVHNSFNPFDLRLRFQNWWRLGYCNAFGYDEERKSKNSCGQGGNISLSMTEFSREKNDYTKAGDLDTSGNGSVMRNSAIPIFFHDNLDEAMEFAYKQSKTTHQGEEAAECCRLLTFICISGINSSIKENPKQILEHLQFKSPLASVQCLCDSQQEPGNDPERNWNWKDPNFQFAPGRARIQPGYIGSYCMDAMAMALHCVWSTDSFKDAMLKSANLCGDSDSVSAVTGQIAGSIYGVTQIPEFWIRTIMKWDPKGDIPLRAYKLFKKEHIQTDGTNEGQ